MGENIPYTSYLSQKEHSFIKKCNFCTDLNLLKKNFFGVQVQWVKNAPLEKILARTLTYYTPLEVPSHARIVSTHFNHCST
jgi:hypothetical protein